VPARSFLYVPGDRYDRLGKALERAGDAVIADLEDAVAPANKDLALETVLSWLDDLPGARPEIWVRVNSGPRLHDELAALNGQPLTAVLEANAEIAPPQAAAGPVPFAVAPLVETARGILELPQIAAVPGVSHVGLGEADLGAELGLQPGPDERELWPLRLQAVVASAAAGIAPPTGPVHTAIKDLDGLRESTLALKRAGFGARSAIHPNQVAVIEEALTPTADEIAAARELVEAWDAAGQGVAVDSRGRMIDEAVVRSARRVVELAERLGL
jgi:citrate lyase subunit beta/citryl-CoA lyase